MYILLGRVQNIHINVLSHRLVVQRTVPIGNHETVRLRMDHPVRLQIFIKALLLPLLIHVPHF